MNLALALTLALLAPAPPAQRPAADAPDPAKVLVRFDKLADARQQQVLRYLERRVLLDPDETIQRIVSFGPQWARLSEAEPKKFHDPSRWARGVAPERKLIKAGTAKHDRVRARLPRVEFLPRLNKAVFYDWGAGRVVRRKTELTASETFENYLNGFPPFADAAAARVLEMLDKDKKMRRMAVYLDHLYADLGGNAYENITLYEAWYSGAVVDVPDVDAIPFERNVLRTRRFRSPIPAGRRRTQLYQQIQDYTFRFRKYRSLREAAAAAYVCAKPIMDPTYAKLVPRFHYLYVTHDDDVAALAKTLAHARDREALLDAVDRKIKASNTEFARREGRRQELTAMAERLAQMAVATLEYYEKQ